MAEPKGKAEERKAGATEVLTRAEEKVKPWASFVKLVRELVETGLNMTGLLAFLGITLRGHEPEPKAGGEAQAQTREDTNPLDMLQNWLDANFGQAVKVEKPERKQRRIFDKFLGALTEHEAEFLVRAICREHSKIKSPVDVTEIETSFRARYFIRTIADDIGEGPDQKAKIEELVKSLRRAGRLANPADKAHHVAETWRYQRRRANTIGHLFLACIAVGPKAVYQSVIRHEDLLELDREIRTEKDPGKRAELEERRQKVLHDVTVAFRNEHPVSNEWSLSDKLVIGGGSAFLVLLPLFAAIL